MGLPIKGNRGTAEADERSVDLASRVIVRASIEESAHEPLSSDLVPGTRDRTVVYHHRESLVIGTAPLSAFLLCHLPNMIPHMCGTCAQLIFDVDMYHPHEPS